jgi:hypothetical protein
MRSCSGPESSAPRSRCNSPNAVWGWGSSTGRRRGEETSYGNAGIIEGKAFALLFDILSEQKQGWSLRRLAEGSDPCREPTVTSSPEQARGDSLRRQVEQSEQFSAPHGLVLDKQFQLPDIGKSAYSGVNTIDGPECCRLLVVVVMRVRQQENTRVLVRPRRERE